MGHGVINANGAEDAAELLTQSAHELFDVSHGSLKITIEQECLARNHATGKTSFAEHAANTRRPGPPGNLELAPWRNVDKCPVVALDRGRASGHPSGHSKLAASNFNFHGCVQAASIHARPHTLQQSALILRPQISNCPALAMCTDKLLKGCVETIDDFQMDSTKVPRWAEHVFNIREKGGEEVPELTHGIGANESSNLFRSQVLPAHGGDRHDAAEIGQRSPGCSQLDHHHLRHGLEAARLKVTLHSFGEGPHDEAEDVVHQHHGEDETRTSQHGAHLQQVGDVLRAVAGLFPGHSGIQCLVHDTEIVYQRPRNSGQVDHLSGPTRRSDRVGRLPRLSRHRLQDVHSLGHSEKVVHLLGRLEDIHHTIALSNGPPDRNIHTVEWIPRGARGGVRRRMDCTPRRLRRAGRRVSGVRSPQHQTAIAPNTRQALPECGPVPTGRVGIHGRQQSGRHAFARVTTNRKSRC
jgi:hypothetical protein